MNASLQLGDRRIDGGRVSVTPLPSRDGQPAAVRVRASVTVDEPVVVVQVSAGCQGRVSRSYTFFAELPEAAPRSAMPVDLAKLSSAPVVAATAAGTALSPATAEPRRTPPAAVSKPAPAPRAPVKVAPPKQPPKAVVKPPAPAPAPAPAPVPAPAVAATQPPQPESRLRMEPLEAWSGPTAAGASPGTKPHSDADAAAQPPAASAADAAAREPADARVQALEAQMLALKAREVSQNASLTQMRSELAALQARDEGSIWTIPLLAALAIALAALGWLLLRLRGLAQNPQQQAWLHSVDASLRASGGAQEPVASNPFEAAGAQEHVTTLAGTEMPPAPAAVHEESAAPDFGPATLLAAPVVAAAPRVRDVVKPEELMDVRQQAEFFTSVGEYEQAIAVMRKHIAQHEDSSPLAYLELLGLFYQLSRKNEFDALRAQFEQHFAARVPDMAQFAQRGKSLEHYTELLATIEALWPTDEVGDLLESYLFRHQGPDSGVLFDLAAFDDLLLLQAVARTTPAAARGNLNARLRTTPAVAPVDQVQATPVAAAGAGLALADEPWATLEKNAAAPALVNVPLMPELDLEIPSRFDVPDGAFARSSPLNDGAADMPAASPLLDIDLSDVGRLAPLDLPKVEPLPFDALEFPSWTVAAPADDQAVGFNARDPKRPMSVDLELEPWDQDAPESIFTALNSARTALVAPPSAEANAGKPKPDDDKGPKSPR
ncbi:hypothetical protein N0K08_19000 [Acidovorax sp. Be4]|uniref:Uncharacterized protein n=1 Tax=Acidovorax bellezanensis TaxID=2976702 RepID=A0ABT2PQI1_9BURK|nr:hypothetical protein [Acidovorax sp. Be4]MCT9812725.1 hypothetical protein [Acidovorax sp. Be4]